jgi:hypothetical protein
MESQMNSIVKKDKKAFLRFERSSKDAKKWKKIFVVLGDEFFWGLVIFQIRECRLETSRIEFGMILVSRGIKSIQPMTWIYRGCCSHHDMTAAKYWIHVQQPTKSVLERS